MLSELTGPPVEQDGPQTLAALLLDVCRRYADREALVLDDPLQDGTTVRWTFADLEHQARAVARALLAHDLGGRRVAILMANRPEAVAALFGTALAGAVAVPLSTFSTRDELRRLLEHSGTAFVLAQERMGERSFGADLEGVPRAVLGDPSWDAFLAAGDAVPADEVDRVVAATSPDDDALVLYSSGTTAAPKGVLHRHRAPTLQLRRQVDLFGRHPQTRMWTALPVFWTAGMNAVGGTLAAGGCCVLQEGFDAGVALRLLERERVTEPYPLPHQARALAEHPDWESTDLSALRCVFGKSVFARHPTVTADPGWQMPVGWGMSETCSFVSALPSSSPREAMRASLGRLLPGLRLKVVDPSSGRTLPVGEDGELLVQGATLMAGYVGRPAAECFDTDGWFRTGDVGHVDVEGRVHWTGRRTELIRTGGVNVSPAEIEVQLRAHPEIRLARVLALPDERLDQVPVLCVELVEGAAPDPDGLRAFLRGRLSSYKVPKQVMFFGTGEIPLTAGGTKVRDDALRELVQARTTEGTR